MKSAYPQCRTIFCPVRWLKDLLPQHDWFKFIKLCETEAVHNKKVGYGEFENGKKVGCSTEKPTSYFRMQIFLSPGETALVRTVCVTLTFWVPCVLTHSPRMSYFKLLTSPLGMLLSFYNSNSISINFIQELSTYSFYYIGFYYISQFFHYCFHYFFSPHPGNSPQLLRFCRFNVYVCALTLWSLLL